MSAPRCTPAPAPLRAWQVVAARCLVLAAAAEHRERVHRARRQQHVDRAAAIDARPPAAIRAPQIVVTVDSDRVASAASDAWTAARRPW